MSTSRHRSVSSELASLSDKSSLTDRLEKTKLWLPPGPVLTRNIHGVNSRTPRCKACSKPANSQHICRSNKHFVVRSHSSPVHHILMNFRNSVRKSITKGFNKLRTSRSDSIPKPRKPSSKGKDPVREEEDMAPLSDFEAQVTSWPPQRGEAPLESRIVFMAPQPGEAGPSEWLGRPSDTESIVSVDVDEDGNFVRRDRRASLFQAVSRADSSVIGAPCESRKEVRAKVARSVSFADDLVRSEDEGTRASVGLDAAPDADEGNGGASWAEGNESPKTFGSLDSCHVRTAVPATKAKSEAAVKASGASDKASTTAEDSDTETVTGPDDTNSWESMSKTEKRDEVSRLSSALAKFELSKECPQLPPLRLPSDDGIFPLTPILSKLDDSISPLTSNFSKLELPSPILKSDEPSSPEKPAVDSHRPSETSTTEEGPLMTAAGQDGIHPVWKEGDIGAAARAECLGREMCYLTEQAGANWWHKQVREKGDSPVDGQRWRCGRWGLQ